MYMQIYHFLTKTIIVCIKTIINEKYFRVKKLCVNDNFNEKKKKHWRFKNIFNLGFLQGKNRKFSV